MRAPKFITRFAATALRLSIIMLTLALWVACAPPAEEVTKDIVERVLKSGWDRSETSTNSKSALTLNEVKFGKPAVATVQEVQVEGIPDGAMVTPAVVDFTVRTYYASEIQGLRRVREARVYRDKMSEWAVMTGSVKGQDTTTTEPLTK